MNQTDIFNFFVNYEKEYPRKCYSIQNYYKNKNNNCISISYIDEITTTNFLELMLSGHFLRREELFIPILPFLLLDNSRQIRNIISTYRSHFHNNHDDFLSFLRKNEMLLSPFSTTNKEIYHLVKAIIPNSIENISSIFHQSNITSNSLFKNQPSISYDIDLIYIMDRVSVADFNFISTKLIKSFVQLEENTLLLKKLHLEQVVHNYHDDSPFLTITFINIKNKQLVQTFMNHLLDYFIEQFDHFSKIEEVQIERIIHYSSLDLNIPSHISHHENNTKFKI